MATWVLLGLPLSGQQYAGAEACGKCHPAQFAKQAASEHRLALSRAAQHPLAGRFAPRRELFRSPSYHFRFRREAGGLRVRAQDGSSEMDIPVEWAFGAGSQAVTFVTRISPDWYLEHYLSYYAALADLAPTPGQDALKPDSLPHAMGLVYPALDPASGIVACFECHSTGPVSRGEEIRPHEVGVRCEACHGPGARHAAAGGGRSLIGNPKRLSAAELNRFCGRCHRPPASEGIAIDWNYAWNVRHQPVYLSQSACFLKGRGRLSCLTCHDPHGPLETTAASYNQRCSTCHTMLSPQCGANCVDCHMPRVSPQANLRFTNHWIGVYGADSRLKPRR